MEKVRLDKWLWSVRIFKTRSIAAEACKSGNVKNHKKSLKPSFMVAPNDLLFVKKNGFLLQYQVLKTITKRDSAPLAQECYIDLTPAEELNKYKDWFIGKARPEMREKGAGRPTKRERREIDDYKGLFLEEE